MNASYYNKNRKNAYKFFGLKMGKTNGFVLHHKDMNLINEDIQRYNEWRPEDLVVLTREEHARIHHTGAKRPKWVCDKISKANKGRKNNFTFYKNLKTGETISVKDGCTIPDGFIKGRILKEEHIRKIAESKKGSIPWNKGIPMKEEQKEKMSLARIGKFVGKDNPHSKKVAQYTKDNKLVKIWDCMMDAERQLSGVNRNHICGCCRGERKSHAGFIWRYA